jgi:hypothetical protein
MCLRQDNLRRVKPGHPDRHVLIFKVVASGPCDEPGFLTHYRTKKEPFGKLWQNLGIAKNDEYIFLTPSFKY